LEELLEIWVSRTLGMHGKPVVVLDPDGLYDPLRAQVDLLVERGFVRDGARDAITWVTTVTEAFDAVEVQLADAGPPTVTAAPDEVLEAEP
jgi:predicted Rossmann-fold nucleotide-binding protein